MTMNDNLDSIAQHLGSMVGRNSPPKPLDVRKFLQTPAGQEAARSAIEGIIGANNTHPLPIPAYKAILQTIKGSMGGGM
jgi:hypothetical protein